jgi:hypothetical protein
VYLTPAQENSLRVDTSSSLSSSHLLFLGLLLVSDLCSFGSIINRYFLEPRMSQSLFCSDSLVGIIDKDLLEKIKELSIKF